MGRSSEERTMPSDGIIIIEGKQLRGSSIIMIISLGATRYMTAGIGSSCEKKSTC
jgi:hypothetical protein